MLYWFLGSRPLLHGANPTARSSWLMASSPLLLGGSWSLQRFIDLVVVAVVVVVVVVFTTLA